MMERCLPLRACELTLVARCVDRESVVPDPGIHQRVLTDVRGHVTLEDGSVATNHKAVVHARLVFIVHHCTEREKHRETLLVLFTSTYRQLNSLTSRQSGGAAVGTAQAQTAAPLSNSVTAHAQCPHLVWEKRACLEKICRCKHRLISLTAADAPIGQNQSSHAKNESLRRLSPLRRLLSPTKPGTRSGPQKIYRPARGWPRPFQRSPFLRPSSSRPSATGEKERSARKKRRHRDASQNAKAKIPERTRETASERGSSSIY